MGKTILAFRAEFFAELGEIRERNYAVDREERITGLRCIATPITDDRSIISVASPTHRVSDESAGVAPST